MVDSTASCSGLITVKEDAANNYARGHYASARNSETAELGRKLVGWFKNLKTTSRSGALVA